MQSMSVILKTIKSFGQAIKQCSRQNSKHSTTYTISWSCLVFCFTSFSLSDTQWVCWTALLDAFCTTLFGNSSLHCALHIQQKLDNFMCRYIWNIDIVTDRTASTSTTRTFKYHYLIGWDVSWVVSVCVCTIRQLHFDHTAPS